MFVFPTIARDLSEHIPEIPQIKDHFEKVLYYNVPNRKRKNLMLLAAYKEFENPKNITNENIKLANILVWCVEMMRSSWAMQNDIIDANGMKETTR
ncbi:hypothetical protein ILUMI_10431, partial [Ignelater luminosus]